MERAFRKGALWAVPAAALFLSSAWAAEGLEAPPPGVESSPAGSIVSTPAPKKVKSLKRAKKAVSRGLARAIQPLFNYSRHNLARLLPSSKHLPTYLRIHHGDYLPPFQWIPRGWTTFDWGRPDLIVGNQTNFNQDAPKPIGERGSFQVSMYPELPVPLCWCPLYIAFTLPNGVHFRLGARWDDVDSYVVAPSVAIKRDVE